MWFQLEEFQLLSQIWKFQEKFKYDIFLSKFRESKSLFDIDSKKLLTFPTLEIFYQKSCFQMLERLKTFPRITAK